jgi:prepilin-type processing-associated H-X9-DG protein
MRLAWPVLALSALAFGVACAGGGGGSGTSARSVCAANLARLYRATIQYGNDWDDVLPAARWSEAVTPYLAGNGASLDCPSLGEGGYGYAMSASLVGTSINFVAAPDAQPLFFDTEAVGPDVTGTFDANAVTRHGGSAVVYLSGRTVPEVADDPNEPVPVREACLDHLRRIGTATNLYASDYDDVLPVADWTDAFEPYVAPNVDAFRCAAVAVGSYGYAFETSLLGSNVTAASSPATTPAAFDSTILTRNATSGYEPTATRHGGANVAYLDGHAAALP